MPELAYNEVEYLVELVGPLPKVIVWMGNSREVLRTFPKTVREVLGFALYQAQMGSKHVFAKPLRDFGSGVFEIVSDHRDGTFRAVYTVHFAERVYVLHIFQKKSKSGIATPKRDLELIAKRLKRAQELHDTLGNIS
jgi:phage-related protein